MYKTCEERRFAYETFSVRKYQSASRSLAHGKKRHLIIYLLLLLYATGRDVSSQTLRHSEIRSTACGRIKMALTWFKCTLHRISSTLVHSRHMSFLGRHSHQSLSLFCFQSPLHNALISLKYFNINLLLTEG